VRDVHRVFAERVQLMLDQDDPLIDNWDQDRTALESGYAQQLPAPVAEELVQRIGLHNRHPGGVPPA
jgi:hypothetical protein